MRPLSSFFLSRCVLGLLAMLAVFPALGQTWSGGGSVVINPPRPPDPYKKVYLETMKLESGTLTLNIPKGGVVEMDAKETSLFYVSAVGVLKSGGVREYAWSSNHASERKNLSSDGPVYLEWTFNGEDIGDFAKWIKDGNPGKSGSYEVRLMQSAAYTREWTDLYNYRYDPYTYYDTHTLDKRSFELVIRDHTPLAAGAAPVFLSEPELEEVTVVPEEGVFLPVEANAGGSFRFRWYRNGKFWSFKKNLRVLPKDIEQGLQSVFYCEVSGPTGKAVTRQYKLRLKGAARLDFTGSAPLAEEGGKIRLEPKAVAESPMTFSWKGPALSAADGRAQVLEDGTLEISPARLEDSGDYVLTVDNGEVPVSRTVRVGVVRLPSGVYPLRAGQVVTMEGKDTSSMVDVRYDPLTVTLKYKDYLDVSLLYTGVTVVRPQPNLAGQYRCVITGRAQLPKDYYNWRFNNWSPQLVPAPFFRAVSTFELRLPTELPVMPAHALPPGILAQGYYHADAPVQTGGLESAATHYEVTGLPPGLKAELDGSVHGSATKAGDYQVKFTAVNGLGRTSVVVPLHIAPLPEGLVGNWVASFSDGQGNYVVQLKISPNGAFTGRWHGGKSVKGRLYLEDSGMASLELPHGNHGQTLWISPETNEGRFYSYSSDVGDRRSGQGWRNVWSRSAPASAYEGKYLVDASEVGLTVPVKDRTGNMWVKRLGQTRMVSRWSELGRTTSSYFLGPQRQILHRWLDEKMKPSTRSQLLHLELDEAGEKVSLSGE